MFFFEIIEDDIRFFNRRIEKALRDGCDVVSSNTRWDYTNEKTIYYALVVDKSPDDEIYDNNDSIVESSSAKIDERVEISAIDYILAFATKNDLTLFRTAIGNNQITPEIDEDYIPTNILGRVYNNGRGLLSIACFADDDVLIINAFMLSVEELDELTQKLNSVAITYKIVHFTPEDFRKGYRLVSYYRENSENLARMEAIQRERNSVNFIQWLLKKK